ncbi:NERD domain-containing protein [Peribacillus sp. SCS-155]|uniref:nuclease-related domain-containing protein n=1 Tax=Peribacillus sedimenti TaxID=3115297 RepID=UPI0039069EA5
MIAKQREIPIILAKLQALLRRLPSQHPKRQLIEKDMAKHKAGFKGEQSVDYHLKNISEKDYYILHNLRLTVEEEIFQIDALFVSQAFALTIEIKNISGTLLFDPTYKQLIRIYDEKETGFPDPVSQVKRQRRRLLSWLKSMKFPPMPIEYLVVISNPSTVIKISNRHSGDYKRICHASEVEEKLKLFEEIHTTTTLEVKEMKKLSRHLIRHYTPQDVDILANYQIKPAELQTGVFCPDCGFLPLKRQHGCWHCPACNTKSLNPHAAALDDYFLLISPTVTNTAFRNFLQVPSRHVACRLLHSLNLPFNGHNKNRVYFPLNN